MGLLGNIGHAVSSYFDGPIPWSDRLQAAGASLGGDPQTAAAIRMNAVKTYQAQQKQTEQRALLKQITDMLGGEPTSTLDQVNAPQVGLNPPATATQASVPISDPRWAKMAIAAPAASINLSSLLKVQEMNKPEYVNGMRVNPNSPSAPSYIPTLDKGQAPDIGPGGQITGVHNLPGNVSAAADMAGAVSNAQEGAKASYDVIPVKLPDGTEVQLPRAIAAPMLAKQFATAGAPEGFGRSQGPAAQAADVARSTAGANADIGLPQQQAEAQQARGVIEALKANPALNDRTGWKSLLPALPGTAGAAFDSADDQLRGKLFMQAYAGLKGGGQITEVEGKKATQAMARLNRSQSAADYRAALNDLESVIDAGLSRAQQQPGRLQPQASGSRGGGSVSAPPSAIGYLRQHPELAGQFDAKYGAGASRSVLGQ